MAKQPQKTLPTDGDVDAFITSVANRVRREDAKQLVALMSRATEQKPVMWGKSIVGFGKVTYAYAAGGEGVAPRVGMSPRASRLVLYLPLARKGVGDRLGELGPHETGVSCLYIKTLSAVDLGVLSQMIAAAFKDSPE